MPEAAVGHVYYVRLYLDHLIVRKAPPIQHALAEVLRNDIADRDELSRKMSLAPGLRMSSVTPIFSTLWLLNVPPRLMPLRSSGHGPLPRKMSHCPCLSLSSTLMTCAPNMARILVAPAPASCPVKSQMRILDSAGQRPFVVVMCQVSPRDEYRGVSHKAVAG